jgi:outer membrane receptor protein involved in Fe transport
MKGKRPTSEHDSKAFTGFTRAGLATALIFVACLPLLAQNTGTLRGRVTDKEGAPLPGAVITAQSEKNPTTRSLGTVADAKGRFRLAGLPPGDDYTVSASFPGMATIIQQPVHIQSDRTSTLDFTLTEEMVETIRVEARGSIVDTTTAATTTTVNEEFIENLPILGRNFSDLLTLAPGVTDTDGDGRPNVHGSREVDFQTRLSGVNVTDPFTGEDASGINIEAIEEVQLILTGASAEYGRFQGGMGNAITKSGGNEFQGSFKVFYQTRSLDSDGAHNQDSVDLIVLNTGEVIDLNESEPASFRTLKPFLTLGGAIKRDRLWYFLANQYIDQQEPINLLGITRNQTIEGWNEYGKLTWQINADHKATLEGLYDPRETTGNNIGLGISPRSDFRMERALPVVTARHTWVMSPTVLLESTVSFLNGRQEVRPVVEPTSLTLACPDLILSDLELWRDSCARLQAESYLVNRSLLLCR